jgi:hypothetical protein
LGAAGVKNEYWAPRPVASSAASDNLGRSSHADPEQMPQRRMTL